MVSKRGLHIDACHENQPPNTYHYWSPMFGTHEKPGLVSQGQ